MDAGAAGNKVRNVDFENKNPRLFGKFNRGS